MGKSRSLLRSRRGDRSELNIVQNDPAAALHITRHAQQIEQRPGMLMIRIDKYEPEFVRPRKVRHEVGLTLGVHGHRPGQVGHEIGNFETDWFRPIQRIVRM